jgi:hypothetical protein
MARVTLAFTVEMPDVSVSAGSNGIWRTHELWWFPEERFPSDFDDNYVVVEVSHTAWDGGSDLGVTASYHWHGGYQVGGYASLGTNVQCGECACSISFDADADEMHLVVVADGHTVLDTDTMLLPAMTYGTAWQSAHVAHFYKPISKDQTHWIEVRDLQATEVAVPPYEWVVEGQWPQFFDWGEKLDGAWPWGSDDSMSIGYHWASYLKAPFKSKIDWMGDPHWVDEERGGPRPDIGNFGRFLHCYPVLTTGTPEWPKPPRELGLGLDVHYDPACLTFVHYLDGDGIVQQLRGSFAGGTGFFGFAESAVTSGSGRTFIILDSVSHHLGEFFHDYPDLPQLARSYDTGLTWGIANVAQITELSGYLMLDHIVTHDGCGLAALLQGGTNVSVGVDYSGAGTHWNIVYPVVTTSEAPLARIREYPDGIVRLFYQEGTAVPKVLANRNGGRSGTWT